MLTSKGFQGMQKDKHLKASSKGGSAKTVKGFATLDAQERNRVARRGAEARWEKARQARSVVVRPTGS